MRELTHWIFIASVLLISSLTCHAQQLPIFTQHAEYGGLINAAFISHNNYHGGYEKSVGVIYRDQWSQLSDRPRTLGIRYDAGNISRKGVALIYGGSLISDRIGVFSTVEIKGRIAAFFKTKYGKGELGGFSIGINAGLGQYTTDLSSQAYIDFDPILFSGRPTVYYPDIGLGAAYINRFDNGDYLQIGLSVPQIFSLDNTFRNDRKTFDIERVPHYYLTASYYKMLTNDTHIELSGWVKRVQNVPYNYDIILRYKFSESMWLGAGANTAGLIHTEIGIILPLLDDRQLRLAYAFNPTFHEHSIVFGNSHELSL